MQDTFTLCEFQAFVVMATADEKQPIIGIQARRILPAPYHRTHRGGWVMASTLLRFTLLVWLVGFGLSSTAAVPTFMPYQGFLADAAGEPVSGSRDMHFALYRQASGGTPIWTETHTAVAVTAGFFQVELGSIEHLDDNLFDAPLFLG